MKTIALLFAFILNSEEFQLFENPPRDEIYDKMQLPLYSVVDELTQHRAGIGINAYGNSLMVIDNVDLDQEKSIEEQFSMNNSQFVMVCKDSESVKAIQGKYDNKNLDIRSEPINGFFILKVAKKGADKLIYPAIIEFIKSEKWKE